MKNMIFIEGVSGVGKTTTVTLLAEKLQNLGYSVSYHLEGEPNSPLDLCWVAYMNKSEYEILLNTYADFAKELSTNITSIGADVLLPYQVEGTKLYSPELYDVLCKHEFCYKPTKTIPLSKFTEVFLHLWQRFVVSEEVKLDYAIFDASFISHMTNDLVRNYNASEDEIVNHLNGLLQIVQQMNPIVFYLATPDVGNRLVMARQSRGQSPPSGDQIAFWNKRKQKDINVLSKLSVESQIKNISENNWDSVIDEIVLDIKNKRNIHQEG